MHIIGKAKKVSIYIGEGDKWGRTPLYMAILELLKKENCAGATVTRGLAGFGAHSQIRTASLVALSSELPLVVEWVDNPARVELLLPRVREMVVEGLITVEEVDVAFYSHRGLRHLSAFVPVQDIMSRDLRTIAPGASLATAVEQLLAQAHKSLLVVDDAGQLVGIITDGDLLKKTGLLTLSASQHLTQPELDAELARLRQSPQVVQQVMTPKPLTLTPETTVPIAVEMMLAQGIKRLPVVNPLGQPVGIVSRVDVLRAFSQPLTVEEPRQNPLPGHQLTIGSVMNPTVPTVHLNDSLADIVRLLVSSVHRRVVVVDGDRRVVGIITDGDLIARATPTERGGLIRSLSRRMAPANPDELTLAKRTAVQVMTRPVVTLPQDAPLIEALNLMLSHQIKRLPVTDGAGRLMGLVGRAAILQALGKTEG
ncbi:MAG: DUF190 domain-containing protein [Anaerolineae bacterium]